MQVQSKRFYPTLTLARDNKGRYRKIVAVQRTVFHPVVNPVVTAPASLPFVIALAFCAGFTLFTLIQWVLA